MSCAEHRQLLRAIDQDVHFAPQPAQGIDRRFERTVRNAIPVERLTPGVIANAATVLKREDHGIWRRRRADDFAHDPVTRLVLWHFEYMIG